MIYFRFFLFFLLSSAFTFAMENPHESSNWPELVQRQAAIKAAQEFLKGNHPGILDSSLCVATAGAGFSAQELFYSNLGFTVGQLLQAHQQLMNQRPRESKKKRQQTEI
jgi:hypothetical protein